MSKLKRYTFYHSQFDSPAKKVDYYLCEDVDKRNAELEELLNDAANVMFDVYFANDIEHIGHGKLQEVSIKIRKALEVSDDSL